jgi:hypothetical protein
MPAPVASIDPFVTIRLCKDMDGRDKPGHDE